MVGVPLIAHNVYNLEAGEGIKMNFDFLSKNTGYHDIVHFGVISYSFSFFVMLLNAQIRLLQRSQSVYLYKLFFGPLQIFW